MLNNFCQGGWWYDTSYRFKIKHRPATGLINLQMWEGGVKIEDSGDIFDNGPDSLKGDNT